jgi:DNA-binding GntR family transcriptional regulator
MSAPLPLARVSTVDALAQALRARILEGDLPGGRRLVEQDLCATYGVARHSVRAALRTLANEGLVSVEAHRGARVRRLEGDDLRGLYELRTALEVEAARLALERNGGILPRAVHDAAARLAAIGRGKRARWSGLIEAHEALHAAIVAAAGSPRLAAAHAGLNAETRLFLVGLRPQWSAERMADDHLRLVAELERDGPEALRRHLDESARALLGEDAVPG